MPQIQTMICGHAWMERPCVFAVNPAEHVCIRPQDHPGLHQCSCGARF